MNGCGFDLHQAVVVRGQAIADVAHARGGLDQQVARSGRAHADAKAAQPRNHLGHEGLAARVRAGLVLEEHDQIRVRRPVDDGGEIGGDLVQVFFADRCG